MAAINKNFVIKNGLEVSTDLIFADAPKNRVGIGTTNPLQKLQIGNVDVSGITTDGKVFVVTSDAKVGVGTTNPLEKFQVGSGSSSFFVTTVGSVGLGITDPQYKLQVIGGIGVTDSFVTGVSTVLTELRVGTGGTVLTVLGVGNSIGIGTASPAFLLDIRSPVSTGQTALYIQGDVRITGDLSVDDITFDDATLSNLTVTEALNVTSPGISTFGGYVDINSDVDISGTLNVVGLSTFGGYVDINNSVDISNDLNVSGIATIATLNATGIAVTNFTVYNNLSVGGISTFTNGPVLIGSGTSTGTASQTLQVTGGTYVSGNLGIGSTNPISKLDVIGDVRVTGVITATTFIGAFSGTLTGTATSTTNIPNLTGAITSVNTTTSLGSFTSAQLATALTDETGSGAAVFATSPTLVTPVLGTPSSGTLTSCTGLPVSTGISGLAANVATFLGTPSSANLASAVTDETGTGALVFATSPTLVTPVLGAATATSIVVGSGVTINASGINAAGIITATTFIGNMNAGVGTITTLSSTNGTITNLTGTAGTITTFNSTSGTITNLTGTAGTITTFNSTNGTITNLNVTGISTLGTVRISSGIITATSGVVTYFGDGSNLTGLAGNPTLQQVLNTGNTSTIGMSIVGVVTATSFVGSGASLTGLTGAGSTVFIDTTTNQEFFPLFTATTSGTITASGISTSKLTYNPSTGAMTAVDFNSTSDINLKENIHTVGNALQITEQLRGVSFDWKETGRSSYGVIAQELEAVLPELVKQGEVKSVNYNGIIGVLIEAIKELKKELEELKVDK
jgi:hypothetical protein